METVNNITSTASKLIWGDPAAAEGEEPRSGETGNTNAGEPYDKGNEEPGSNTNSTDPKTSTLTDNTPIDKPVVEPTPTEQAPIVETNEVGDAAKVDTSGADSKPLSEPNAGAGAGASGDSTGAVAVGGNSDAANARADKEADAKDTSYKAPALTGAPVHQEGPAAASNQVDAKENEDAGSPSGSKLKGLKEKIKAKLHKNKD